VKIHLNTLYVTTQGAYLFKDGETVAVNEGAVWDINVPRKGSTHAIHSGWQKEKLRSMSSLDQLMEYGVLVHTHVKRHLKDNVNVVKSSGVPAWISIGVEVCVEIENDRQFKSFEPATDSDTDSEKRRP
jgi:hypothetical protein